MDTALQALLSYQFLLFCLSVSAVTYIITIIVEYAFRTRGSNAKDSNVWTTLILPILPIFLGCIGGLLAKKYPFPVEIVSASGRVAFGLVGGLLAGFVWRWLKAIISFKVGEISPKQSADKASTAAAVGAEAAVIAADVAATGADAAVVAADAAVAGAAAATKAVEKEAVGAQAGKVE